MYKVFLNDRVIDIVPPGKITLRKSSKIIDNLEDIEAVKRWFADFLKNDIPEVFFIHPVPERFFNEIFRVAFKNVIAAGGIVKRGNQNLFIFRNNKWDLPKGKIDKGETIEEAAIREVAEECGIDGHRIVKYLPSTFHIYQSPYKESKGQWILKETYWFEMEYSGQHNGFPQLEEDITELKWLAKNELQTVLSNTYANLKSIISVYLD